MACGDLATARLGEQVHGHVMKSGFRKFRIVQNTQICMYAKCGDIDSANLTFQETENPDVVSWSLSACSYGGLVEEDLEYVNVLSALVYKDTVTGKRAAMKVIELEPQESASYVPHNIYAEAVAEPLAASIRELMQQRGVKKVPGLGWI
ncbi:hypothetical protein V6N11_019524 [Hibiscus sabdariffa]|uniref:Uncharacterized protein n=1 Tax=Hibiscus sabdariffa TaxID=183260 RepID=A0ABR1ZCA0_9ROSI